MADAEHSSPSSADASCTAVCSSSDASPLSSSLCCAYSGPTASIASPPPWTDKPPAYRPIRTPAINTAICSSFDVSPLPSSLCCACGGPTASVASPPPWTDKPPAYRPIHAPTINTTSQTNAIILTPVPQPLPVPPASPSYHFETPTKRISSSDDLRRFHSSAVGRHFLGFVAALSHSIRSHKLSEFPTPSHPLPKPLWPLWHSTAQAHVGCAVPARWTKFSEPGTTRFNGPCQAWSGSCLAMPAHGRHGPLANST